LLNAERRRANRNSGYAKKKLKTPASNTLCLYSFETNTKFCFKLKRSFILDHFTDAQKKTKCKQSSAAKGK